MKKRRKDVNKLNNNGMTLMEVLIALALLTIVIVPVMSSYVQIAKYGDKGRKLQQTTSIAQTTMENCKAYNLKDIANGLEAGTGSDFFSDSFENAYMNGSTSYMINSTKFFIDNMSVDNQKIGMSVELTPLSGTQVDIMNYENVNDKLDGIFVAQVTENDDATPVNFYQGEIDVFEDIFEEFATAIETKVLNDAGETIDISTESLRVAFFEDDSSPLYGTLEVSRTIEIDANTDSITDEDEVTVDYVYSVQCNAIYDYTMPDGTIVSTTLSKNEDVTKSATIYTNTQTKLGDACLERIYFYYYPTYYDADSYFGIYNKYPCKEDNIEINVDLLDASDNPRDLDVYLVKQKMPDISDILIELAEEDEDYHNKVAVNSTGTVNLYHNYTLNLGDGSAKTWPGVGELSWTDVEPDDKGTLVEETPTDLMYSIQIKIYANPEFDPSTKTLNSGEEILQLDGTKINW